jgi:hypothetical protein
MLVPTGPAQAYDCLLDANNDTNVDTVAGANSDPNTSRVACGNNAAATGPFGTAIGANFSATESDATALGQCADVAAAMALGGTTIVPGKSISMTVAAANYGGQQAFAGSVTGRHAQRLYLAAGVSANTGDNRVGGRVAATFGF